MVLTFLSTPDASQRARFAHASVVVKIGLLYRRVRLTGSVPRPPSLNEPCPPVRPVRPLLFSLSEVSKV